MSTTRQSSPNRQQKLHEISERLRRDSLVATDEAGSGHPTSCLSCAEIMSVLFFEQLRYDADHPDSPNNDQFILSKGHAAPILWSVFHEAGLVSAEELKMLRDIDSDLEGHPTPRNRWVRVATGSLGQGLSMGVGMAWAARHKRTGSRTFVLLGDGETAEGSVWEAAALASHLAMGNLTAIIDINRYGQSGETMLGHDPDVYARRFEAFGWEIEKVDGHDIAALSDALGGRRDDNGKPRVILARTEKGKGVPQIQGERGSHGKPADSLKEATAELDQDAIHKKPEGQLHKPRAGAENAPARPKIELPPPEYEQAESVATRQAFGDAMLALGEASDAVIALDGDVKNSTKLESFFEKYGDRSIECYIAEQNMTGVAVGLDAAGLRPCLATFSAFLTRAFDQLRMAAVSRSRLIVAGSHCGVAIGQDGPSQMGLEDIAMMRAPPGSMVLHPSDAVSTHRALEMAANHDGIAYLRLTRNKLPVIYPVDEGFPEGGSKVHGASEDDRITFVGAGVTLHECLKARTSLREQDIPSRVVDCYSIKPIDTATLRRCAEETGHIVIVEDHYAAGGLGEAVLSALGDTPCKRRHLAVRGISRSGNPAELLDLHGISSSHIEEAALELIR
ncbi:MAG: transketolase [Verrucomicrobiae bacterium]|nr:transketolase [Verrucomicrobiae bacterium]